MKLSKNTVALMISIREGIAQPGCRAHAQATLERQLQSARERLQRRESDSTWSKGSRIAKGLRVARARKELSEWEKLAKSLETTT